METVLFSVVGTSDPIRGGYDGPMLHIIRQYRPQKAYLFMTREICLNDAKDERYVRAVQHVHPDAEVIKLLYEELEQANDFLLFDEIFKKELSRVQQENPGAQILINISSGTTQMISALYLLASVVSYPVTLIQVDTYRKASNDAPAVRREYDIDLELENLMDDLEDAEIENRCREIKPENVVRHLISSAVMSHIQAFDYSAADKLATEHEAFFSENVRIMLKAAKARNQLEHDRAAKYLLDAGVDFYPLKSGDVKPVFEYLLHMQKLQWREDLGEFIKSISPALTTLFAAYLKNNHRVDIYQYCRRGKEVYYLHRENIPEEYLDAYDTSPDWANRSFEFSFLSASTILPMIRKVCLDQKIDSTIFEELRNVERDVRNLAAHEIVAVTESMLKDSLGCQSKDIMDKLRILFERAFPKQSAKWDSYTTMNDRIVAAIQTGN